MSDFKYIVPPNDPKIIRSPGEVGISPTISEPINNSIIFNGSTSALSFTPLNTGNRTAWTQSFWIKRSKLGTEQHLFESGGANFQTFFDVNDCFRWYENATYIAITNQVFRDVSAWYHFVLVWDSGNSISSDRFRIYVNGSRVTSFSSTSNPSLNQSSGWNQASTVHYFGRYNGNTLPQYYFNGYLAEAYVIDGQTLNPSSFGQYSNKTNNVWVPKRYLGSYGTNGFYLKFNNSAALGTDSSGNSNTWTLNNITSSNQTSDSPTNNYCTLNPLEARSNQIAPSNGNLDAVLASGSNAYFGAKGSFFITSGKWYWECTIQTISSGAGQWIGIGIVFDNVNWPAGNGLGSNSGGYEYLNDGVKWGNAVATAGYGASYTTNDVIGVAFDADSRTLEFYKNGVSQGVAFSNVGSGTSIPTVEIYRSTTSSQTVTINFGQRSFTYSPPAGFKSLCTANLNIPIIRKPNQFFDVKTYTGTGSTQNITGLGFSPDLVWIKGRSGTTDHTIYDSIRGATTMLISNSAGAEGSFGNTTQTLTSFNSDGFSLGTNNNVNTNTATYVAWAWDEAPIAGMDIVAYTGTGVARTIAHNLGVAPKMMIVKNRTSGLDSWAIYHSVLGAGKYLLFTTGAEASSVNIWNNTSPTSSVFSVGITDDTNRNNGSFIAYLFAEVEGFSKFGSYTGNGSADGPFVWCGFRPRWVMVKQSSAGGTNWLIDDTARGSINYSSTTDPLLYPNLSIAEANGNIDVLSNGFKIRYTDGDYNASGGTYIFAAFAESPFKYANAR